MDLVERDKPRTRQHCLGRTSPIFRYSVSVVVGADSDIQTRMITGRNAAAPPEKAMRHPSERAGSTDLNRLS
jgi:hypothetical protein